jgi:hypothetical protein
MLLTYRTVLVYSFEAESHAASRRFCRAFLRKAVRRCGDIEERNHIDEKRRLVFPTLQRSNIMLKEVIIQHYARNSLTVTLSVTAHPPTTSI